MKMNKSDWNIQEKYKYRIEKEHEDVRTIKYVRNRGYHPNLSNLAVEGARIGEYPKTYIEIIGNVVVLRNIEKPPTAVRTLRGEIQGFSNKSRRNLQKFLQSIDWDTIQTERVYEITLTYHSIPDSGKKVKEHLHKIRKNIMDKYPGTILIWKLEFQRRGAPHYHLIMIAPNKIELGDYQYIKGDKISYYDRNKKRHMEEGNPGLRAYIQFRWNTILEEGDKHFNSGIEVEKVRNKKGLPHYLAKYIAKERKVSEYCEDQHAVPDWYKSVGRFWGSYNRKLLNIRKKRIPIDKTSFMAISAYARKQWKDGGLPDYKGHDYGLTYYARSKSEIDKEIMDILVDNRELKN